jgi:hypothetical protein
MQRDRVPVALSYIKKYPNLRTMQMTKFHLFMFTCSPHFVMKRKIHANQTIFRHSLKESCHVVVIEWHSLNQSWGATGPLPEKQGVDPLNIPCESLQYSFWDFLSRMLYNNILSKYTGFGLVWTPQRWKRGRNKADELMCGCGIFTVKF